jgi:Protein of unknown function (DUF2752)
MIVIGAAVLMGAAAFLYWVPPTSGSFYPPCTFHALTGLHCPGCGLTRCLHALLHGDVRQAAAYNVYALLLVLFLTPWGVRALWSLKKPGTRWTVTVPRWALRTIFITLLAFWVLRNLDVEPFKQLAPHQL